MILEVSELIPSCVLGGVLRFGSDDDDLDKLSGNIFYSLLCCFWICVMMDSRLWGIPGSSPGTGIGLFEVLGVSFPPDSYP